MSKKIIILAVILMFLAGAGFFYWWQGHADERALNKTLPEGVRIDKCLLTGDWRVINEINDYQFKVPDGWNGVNEIAYIPERTEENYVLATIELEGKEGGGRIVVVNHFEGAEEDLKIWAERNFETFGLVGDFNEDKIEEFNIVKTQENIHLGGMYVYFFKKGSAIYALTCGSEEFIREIILNGRW